MRLFIGAIDIRHKTQILDSAQPIIKIRIVRKIGKHPLRTERILRNIDAVNGNLSLFKLQNSRRTPQRRRLAGSVLTNKANNLPIRDIDGNAMQNFFPPKLLCKFSIMSIDKWSPAIVLMFFSHVSIEPNHKLVINVKGPEHPGPNLFG